MSREQAIPPALSPRKKRDQRLLALVLVLIAVGALGYLMTLLPGRGVDSATTNSQSERDRLHGFQSFRGEGADAGSRPEAMPQATQAPEARTEDQARRQQVTELLAQARKQLQAGRLEEASRLVNQAGNLDPRHSPSYLAMGDVLLAQKRFSDARDYYERAIDLDLAQADAYFGFASASEGLGDLESALGGMRSFLHVVKDADPARLKIAQARSAIWEWESKLGRGPWGPTKGIPPGLTEEQVKRDGRGIATVMPIPGTERPDGSADFEIKHGTKLKIFPKP